MMPLPGWYSDRSGAQRLRYFDGGDCAERYAPVEQRLTELERVDRLQVAVARGVSRVSAFIRSSALTVFSVCGCLTSASTRPAIIVGGRATRRR